MIYMINIEVVKYYVLLSLDFYYTSIYFPFYLLSFDM